MSIKKMSLKDRIFTIMVALGIFIYLYNTFA